MCYFQSSKPNTFYLSCKNKNQAVCNGFNPVNFDIPVNDINYGVLNVKDPNDCNFAIANVEVKDNICYFKVQNPKKVASYYKDCSIRTLANCQSTYANKALPDNTNAQRMFSAFKNEDDCFTTQWDNTNKICYGVNNNGKIKAFCGLQQNDCNVNNIDMINDGNIVATTTTPTIACPVILKEKLYGNGNICYMITNDGTVLKNCQYSSKECYDMIPNNLIDMTNALGVTEGIDLDNPNECVTFDKYDNNQCYVLNNKQESLLVTKINGESISETNCQSIKSCSDVHTYKASLVLNNGMVTTALTFAFALVTSLWIWG